MKQFTIIAIICAFLLGCSKTEQTKTPESSSLITLDTPAEFTVLQRTTSALPGSNGKVVLTTDDITRGQVMVTISLEDESPILTTRSLRENDTVTFTLGNTPYKIKLMTLVNVLVGDDSATFRLQRATADVDNALTENEKIERLILSLEQLTGAKFIRNGQEHALDDAITHMRKKWKWKETEIKTANDFISIAGSKSSTSGNPYIIRMTDGTEIKTEDWLKKQLEVMDSSPNQNIDHDQK